MTKITVNIVSESDISIQGHGVHTAYLEMASALEAHDDLVVVRGGFGRKVVCDIVHIHTVGSYACRKLLQKGPIKVVSAHLVPDSFVGSLVGAKTWRGVAGLYLRWFYNRADLLIAVSPSTAGELKSLGVKTPITTLDNSIDISRYKNNTTGSRLKIRRQLGIKDDTFVVIGAGQVQPRKRVDCFIRAAKACPDIHFIWVGGMPFGVLAADYNEMKLMIDSAPSNVHFTGVVPLDSMPAYYHAADVFWLPSIQETFGLVVVEGAASGLPVMLRDIDDYEETFANYVVKADDSNDIDILKKLRDDTSFREKYTKLSSKLAEKFDSKRATDKLVGIYRDLITDSKN